MNSVTTNATVHHDLAALSFRRFLMLGVAMMLVLTVSVASHGSETTGTIFGTVKDPSGAVVAGATVSVVDINTHSRATKTSSEGDFAFPFLEPGLYVLRVEAPGFRKYVDSRVLVRVGEKTHVLVSMVVGQVDEAVTVRGQATQVDTATAELGKFESRERIATLPLIGRNYLQLAVLQAGVTSPIDITSAETPKNMPGGIGISPNVNGMRNNANNYLLDGSDNNEPFLGIAAVVPSIDAIQEFKIITGLYSAEYGRSGGSVVNVITRSGTNEFHGSAWDFLRNDFFNARNYFADQVRPLKRNQFGATIGGPVVRNKLFFFGSYEGTRESKGDTRNTTVPSIAERNGDFSLLNPAPASCTDPGAVCDPTTGSPFPGNKIPVSRFDPAANLVRDLWPVAPGGGNDFSSQPILPSNANQFSTKVDYQRGATDTFSARYFFAQGDSTVAFQPSFLGPIDVPGFEVLDSFRSQNAVLSHTHVFAANVLNEFRFSYNRAHLIAGENSIHKRLPSDFGFKFEPNEARFFPDIAVSGFSTIGTSDFDNVNRFNNVYDAQDNVAITHGRHQIKTGFQYVATRLNNDIPFSQPFFLFAPVFTGNAFADFLLGDALLLVSGGGIDKHIYTSSRYNSYVQDNIRLRPNFALNIGLRYELSVPWLEEDNRNGIFIPGRQSKVRPTFPPGPLFVGDPGVPPRGSFTDKNNFAPRIGFAWDPFSTGKTSIRAGYGIYYDAGDFNSERFQNGAFPGFFTFLLLFGGNFSDPYPGFGFSSRGPWAPENVADTLSNPPLSTQVNATDVNLRTAYVQHYSLSVEREIRPDYVVEVAYVGNTSRKLIGTVDLNQPFLTPTATAFDVNDRRPLQPWGTINYQFGGLDSSYNALQLTFDKTVSHGFGVRAAYTWSKTIDFGSIPQNFQHAVGQAVFPQDSRNIAAEKGPAAFDARHRLVISYQWELPFFRKSRGALKGILDKWAVAGITTFQSGAPFTILDGTNPSLNGELADRPDVLCDPNSGPHTPQEWFNTSCFKPAAPFGGINHDGYGNSSRNNVRAAGLNVFDFSLIKSIPISERSNIQFRAEFFNLLNHPNFGPPANDIAAPGTFGRVFNTRPDDERQMQFAVKFSF